VLDDDALRELVDLAGWVHQIGARELVRRMDRRFEKWCEQRQAEERRVGGRPAA
jgi:hypothetical protein